MFILQIICNAQIAQKSKFDQNFTRQSLFLPHHIFVPPVLSPTSYFTQHQHHHVEKSKLSKMPKDKTSKAVRYAEYKRLEEGRLFDGVKKLVSFMNLLCKKTNMSKS